MALKFVLCCALVVVFVQASSAGKIEKRESPLPEKTTDVSKEVNDALNVLKTNFDQIIKNIKDNDMLQEFGAKIQKFGEEFSDQSKQLVKKIQTDTKTD